MSTVHPTCGAYIEKIDSNMMQSKGVGELGNDMSLGTYDTGL
jgi:hypothetical protein